MPPGGVGQVPRLRGQARRQADWELGWFFWILLPSGGAMFLFLLGTERTRNRVACFLGFPPFLMQ